MALRLDDLIISGQFFHRSSYCFHGRMLLRGGDTAMPVALTGVPSEDLRGKSFAFEVPANDRPPTVEDRKRVRKLANQQIGTTGVITAAWSPDPAESELEYCAEDEVPRLYLEWFSQNGTVVIDLTCPKFRFLEDVKKPKEPESEPGVAVAEAEPEEAGSEADDSTDALEDFEREGDLSSLELGAEFGEQARGEEDEYGLFPPNLTKDLEDFTRRVDREASGKSEDEIRELEEMEMLDNLIEEGEGQPLSALLEELALPKPVEIETEEQAETALKTTLKRLALSCVAYDICEHCTMREAYRILVEKICSDCAYYVEMQGTDWVQHFSTSDFCAACQAQYEIGDDVPF